MSVRPWPLWERGTAPADLARYTQRGVVSRLLRAAPGPSAASVEHRARQLYEAFAERCISYAVAPSETARGRQRIRTPDEVLLRPGHGTCLDIAVAFASGCLDAGLHPLVAVLDPVAPGDASHAVVVLRLTDDPEDCPLTDVVYEVGAAPAVLIDRLAAGEDEMGDFVAVDVALLAAGYRRGEADRGWDAAVLEGARMLRTRGWQLGVDIGLGHEPDRIFPVPGWPALPVLREPYLSPDRASDDEGPLRQIWARYGVVPFQHRAELDRLTAWCRAAGERPGSEHRSEIFLLYGAGGVGKTRIAAEQAARLAQSGWYTGFLERNTRADSVGWLARVVSPLLVVVDYADDRRTEEVTALLDALLERTAPTCVLLTARSAGPWWEDDIVEERIGRAEQRHTPLEVTSQPPRPKSIFQAALSAFAGVPAVSTAQPPERHGGGSWGTLDLVMLGWLTARRSPGELPRTPDELYAKILKHELRYWRRTHRKKFGTPLEPEVISASAACVSYLAPVPDRVPYVLESVGPLAGAAWAYRRAQVADIITTLIPTPDPGGELFLQPDLLAEYLVLHTFGHDTALRSRCLAVADQAELLNSCVTVTRAWQQDNESAGRLARAMLTERPDIWQPALQSSLTHNGPFIQPLEALAAAETSPLPLDRLAHELPLAHGTVRGIALIAAERSVAPSSARADGKMRRSFSLGLLAVRLAEAGRRHEALEAVLEAVALRRELVAADRDEHLPNLAAALNNLANSYGGVGRWEEGLAAARESTSLYRSLADRDADAYLADFTRALNTLSSQLSKAGKHQEALSTLQELVGIRRRLAKTDPELHQAAYASSLSVLSVRLAATGAHGEAHETAVKALGYYRTLAAANPATHGPELGRSLLSLSHRLGQLGRHPEAVASAEEATGIFRGLADANGGGHRADLAICLHSLATRLKNVGRYPEARTAAAEAVDRFRALAEENRGAHLPALGTALRTLAAQLANTREWVDAEQAAAEALAVQRELVQEQGDSHRPELAAALHGHSLRLGALRHAAHATETAEEAVACYRALSETDPERHRLPLAQALNNLAHRLSLAHQDTEALAVSTEALEHFRILADQNAALHTEHFAMALNNNANKLAELGRHQEALPAADEAVRHFRVLASARPAVHRLRLATALSTQARMLLQVRRQAEGIVSASESVALRRAEAALGPGRRPQLATGLAKYSDQLAKSGHREEGLVAAAEAVALCRGWQIPRPDLVSLAELLHPLLDRLFELDFDDKALQISREILHLRRRLAAERSAPYPPAATALYNVAVALDALGRRGEALPLLDEAVGICREAVFTRSTPSRRQFLADTEQFRASLLRGD
ncbi:tetratricopeptide repeat protein [Streptomyces sp. NBC_01450]|uniref:tetratricopeptide repeat protein n=1 Tax=Streptomyces sp. NBC_01450 TaxID=2903871 RepID=UPI002E348367|nr:tetratricopeptide repeat protein [Streptomyces sp. NBC_01450]